MTSIPSLTNSAILDSLKLNILMMFSQSHLPQAWIRNAAQKHPCYYFLTLQKQQIHSFWLFFLETLFTLLWDSRDGLNALCFPHFIF